MQHQDHFQIQVSNILPRKVLLMLRHALHLAKTVKVAIAVHNPRRNNNSSPHIHHHTCHLQPVAVFLQECIHKIWFHHMADHYSQRIKASCRECPPALLPVVHLQVKANCIILHPHLQHLECTILQLVDRNLLLLCHLQCRAVHHLHRIALHPWLLRVCIHNICLPHICHNCIDHMLNCLLGLEAVV